VNPVAPAEAYLEPASLGMILFLPLPLLFAAIGFGALYGIWFYRGKPEPTVKAISAGARTPLRRGVRFALWAALTGISGTIFFGGCWRPAVRIATSPLWQPADCTVEFSRVGISHGDDGNTYRVDLLYTYEVEGVRYRSSRHRLVTYSSGGGASQMEAVWPPRRGEPDHLLRQPDGPGRGGDRS
jgi:hypothetical protein